MSLEALLAGIIGFLVGRGIAPKDAKAIVEALEKYLGYEPPLGLTGYSTKAMERGKRYKGAVVVRGKEYDAYALDDISLYTAISVLGKREGYLDVAPIIEHKYIRKGIELVVKHGEVTCPHRLWTTLVDIKGKDLHLTSLEISLPHESDLMLAVAGYDVEGEPTDKF